jgi:hypothetical protein
MGIRRFLAPPGPAASEAERLEWIRNAEATLLVAGSVALVAAVIYLPVWAWVILGLVLLRTVQRVVVLTRRMSQLR